MKEFILKLVKSSIDFETNLNPNFQPNQEWLKKEFMAMVDILDVEDAFKYFDDVAETLSLS